MSTNPSSRPTSPVSPENVPIRPASAGRHWLGWTILVVVVLAVAYAAVIRPLFLSSASARAGAGGRPLPVSAEPARKADLNVRIVALGTVTPVSTVTVRSRVDGQLQKILFKEGQEVEAGAPLVEVDPRNKEAWYSLGVIDWTRWAPRWMNALTRAGMNSYSAFPITDATIRSARQALNGALAPMPDLAWRNHGVHCGIPSKWGNASTRARKCCQTGRGRLENRIFGN